MNIKFNHQQQCVHGSEPPHKISCLITTAYHYINNLKFGCIPAHFGSVYIPLICENKDRPKIITCKDNATLTFTILAKERCISSVLWLSIQVVLFSPMIEALALCCSSMTHSLDCLFVFSSQQTRLKGLMRPSHAANNKLHEIHL